MAQKERSERQILEEISTKLERLLAVVAVQGRDADIQIRVLTKAGFSSSEIGALLGMHPTDVRHRRRRR